MKYKIIQFNKLSKSQKTYNYTVLKKILRKYLISRYIKPLHYTYHFSPIDYYFLPHHLLNLIKQDLCVGF